MSRWKEQSGRRLVHSAVPVCFEDGKLILTGGSYRQELLSAADLLDESIFSVESVPWLYSIKQRLDAIHAVGSPWFGFDQVEPYGVVFLDGGTLDGADPEYSDFADFLLDPAQAHLVQPANLAAFDVDSVTREIRLPDVRGLGLRLAGLSAAFQMAGGAYYDGGSVLAVLLDMMQGHRHNIGTADNGGSASVTVATLGAGTGQSGGATAVVSLYVGNARSDGTNGPIRSGAETRGASVSLKMGVRYK